MVNSPQTPLTKPRRRERWGWGVVAVVLLVITVISLITAMRTQPSLEAPALTPTPKPAATQDVAQAPTPSPTPTVSIDGSPVVQIYVPSDNPDDVINSTVYPMPTSCQHIIKPPEDGQNFLKVFQCTDFAMPGTATNNNVVVAGHSSKYAETVFNRLYKQGESLIGRLIYIRTVKSGTHWLVYKIQKVYEPVKKDLPFLSQVWEPTNGRLIVVTCLQQSATPLAVKNFIVVAQFEEVQ
jgi:hypothetical protein